MTKAILPILFLGIISFFSITVFARVNFNFLQITHPAISNNTAVADHWLGIIELPLMLLSVFFAFATASKMKHGKFGKGMKFLAWGFLIMATGHAHMQFENFTGINLFGEVFGNTGGQLTWIIALLCTWGLSALGLYNLYKESTPTAPETSGR